MGLTIGIGNYIRNDNLIGQDIPVISFFIITEDGLKIITEDSKYIIQETNL